MRSRFPIRSPSSPKSSSAEPTAGVPPLLSCFYASISTLVDSFTVPYVVYYVKFDFLGARDPGPARLPPTLPNLFFYFYFFLRSRPRPRQIYFLLFSIFFLRSHPGPAKPPPTLPNALLRNVVCYPLKRRGG